MRMRRAAVVVLGAVLLGVLAPVGASAETAVPLPATMAAVGDSITQAASSDGSLGVDAPRNSWATGWNATVSSHAQRLAMLGQAPAIHNRSVSGAKVGDLQAQMVTVVPVQPDYLTVLIGGNDLCTDTVEQMTPVDTFRTQFGAAMAELSAGSPETHVLVASIPDAYRLWELFRTNYWARLVWSAGDICQSLLQDPGSTRTADVQRRADVRQRNIEYNVALEEVCGMYPRCRFDGNAVFDTAFVRSDVSGDYFHPSIAGQAKIAATTWAAGYAWATTPPPPPTNQPPTAAFTSACSDLSCTFTDASTDADGTIAQWAWSFGDAATSTATNPGHTYTDPGTYDVSLTVTDDLGLTSTTSGTVTVSAAPTVTDAWIADLTAMTSGARNAWSTTITVTVAAAGGGVPDATVTGTWSGTSGATSCTTNTAGSCSIASANINKKTSQVTFSVTDVSATGYAYASASNAESTITVTKP